MAKDDAEMLYNVAEELNSFIEEAAPAIESMASATDAVAETFGVLPVEVQMHMAIHTWNRHREDVERLFHAFGTEQLSPQDMLQIKGYLALVIAAMTYIDLVLNEKIPVIDQKKRQALTTVTRMLDRKLFESQQAAH